MDVVLVSIVVLLAYVWGYRGGVRAGIARGEYRAAGRQREAYEAFGSAIDFRGFTEGEAGAVRKIRGYFFAPVEGSGTSSLASNGSCCGCGTPTFAGQTACANCGVVVGYRGQ
jgi:hypothetical protein